MKMKPGTGQTDWDSLIGQFAEEFESRGKSRNTITAYASDLGLLAEWHCGTYGRDGAGQLLSGLSSIDLLDHVRQLKAKSSPQTVNRKIAAIRAFFAFLLEKGLIGKDHSAALKSVRVEPPKAPEVLTHAEFLRLLRVINRDGERGRRDWAVIHLMAQAGLRIGEVADVRLGDLEIGPRKGILLIRSGKGGQPRRIFLNSTAREAILDYLEVRPKKPDMYHLFVSQKGSPLSRRAIHNLVVFYMQRAGLPGRSAHSLRHLFAARLYNGSKDILLVREALGHRSIKTTLRYARKTEFKIAEKIEGSELNIYRD